MPPEEFDQLVGLARLVLGAEQQRRQRAQHADLTVRGMRGELVEQRQQLAAFHGAAAIQQLRHVFRLLEQIVEGLFAQQRDRNGAHFVKRGAVDVLQQRAPGSR